MRPIQLLVRLRQAGKCIPNRVQHLARHVFAIVVASLLWPVLAWAAPPAVNLLVAEPTGIYQEAATRLSQALDREDWRVTVSTPDRHAANGADLTVAIGTKALETALARSSRPVLALLVPRLTFERLTAGQTEVSALYLDQPLTRQLQLLGLALPTLKKAGVPLGPVSQEYRTVLQSAAKDTDIQVKIALIGEGSDVYAALTELAKESQAFVLLPDPVVTQRSTLQNFLLHTYRLRKPVLAYSAPLVQSGALLALYATPAQQGEEAAGWIRESWSKGVFRLGASRYPRRFTIGVNQTVARSLDISLPGEDVLTRQLEALP